jgi:hypothetical protein
VVAQNDRLDPCLEIRPDQAKHQLTKGDAKYIPEAFKSSANGGPKAVSASDETQFGLLKDIFGDGRARFVWLSMPSGADEISWCALGITNQSSSRKSVACWEMNN